MKPWTTQFWNEELPALGFCEVPCGDTGFREYRPVSSNSDFIRYWTDSVRQGRTPWVKVQIAGIALEFKSPSALTINAIINVMRDHTCFLLLTDMHGVEPWIDYFYKEFSSAQEAVCLS